MIVAITGGIGTGKSSVSEYLVRLAQAEYCDTDQYCKDLLMHGKAGWLGVVTIWGKRFLDNDANIDRPLLRKAIFNESAVRRQLEDILHPLVREHVAGLKIMSKQKNQILIVEVPLLFEVSWQGDFDKVITVSADEDVCLERVMGRDSVTKEEAKKIMSAQIPSEEKVKLADYVIENSGSWKVTCHQVEDVLRCLQEFLVES